MTISYADHFLIAYPTLQDPNFHQSVIYLYEHSDEGAMGLVINKALKMKLHEVFDHLEINIENADIEQRHVMMGGPIGQEHGFVLYRPDSKEKAEEKSDMRDVRISSSKETLTAIAKNEGPEEFLITLGYAGWDSGQLEQEIQRNDWLVVPFDVDIVFKTPLEQRWREAAALIGVDVDRLSGHGGHA